MPTVTIVLTSGTRWRVPADCTSATIECIGGGAFSGGAYARTNNVTLTPTSSVFISIASYGPYSTWFNKTANVAPTAGQTDRGALAAGGSFGLGNGTYNIGGGAAINSVGDVRYDGGGARIFYDCGGCGCSTLRIYSFGGAAGPNGVGGNGLLSGTTYGGGGGANGGGGGTSTLGGNNRLGTGGGANNGGTGSNGGGGGPNGAGTTGQGSYDPIYTDTYSGLTYGPSGGAGASSTGGNAPKVTRGAGGGAVGGTPGMIVITYTPITLTPGTYTEIIPAVFPGNTLPTWYPPNAVTSLTLEAIGGGPLGTGQNHGGGYVKSVVPKSILYVWDVNTAPYISNVGFVPPTSPTQGVYAPYSGSLIGTTTYAGGVKGANYNDGGDYYLTGGGGGAAGPDGPGSNGGSAYPGFSGTGILSGAGGGGSASGAGQTVGSAGTLTQGGAGGSITGGTGGTGGTASSKNGTAGTNGGGGGGAYAGSSSVGGGGSQRTIWTDSFNGTTAGPWGGGGGIMTDGTFYAAGGGGSSGNNGGDGVLIISYTIPATGSTGNMFMMFG